MAIVARMGRRLGAFALAVGLAACNPVPSASPGATATGAPGTATASPGTAGEPPACIAKGPPVEEPAAWHGRVFYEAFVRSFADSDGDGVGDLAGMTDRLDYLNDGDPATDDDLGITGIWLMPVAEALSYHGYDVLDYTAVERDYGDAAAMRSFVQAAQARGILVIVDLVVNHTSRDHPWFLDAGPGDEHADWYLWEDERPPVARSDGTRVWHEADGRFYYGYFWEGMPDLNLGNPDVTAELDAVAEFWLATSASTGSASMPPSTSSRTATSSRTSTRRSRGWRASVSGSIQGHPDALVLGEVFDRPR